MVATTQSANLKGVELPRPHHPLSINALQDKGLSQCFLLIYSKSA